MYNTEGTRFEWRLEAEDFNCSCCLQPSCYLPNGQTSNVESYEQLAETGSEFSRFLEKFSSRNHAVVEEKSKRFSRHLSSGSYLSRGADLENLDAILEVVTIVQIYAVLHINLARRLKILWIYSCVGCGRR